MLTLLPLLCLLQELPSAEVVAPRQLPLAFVSNQGQWPDAIRFRADSGPLVIGCEPDALHLLLRSESGSAASLRMAFKHSPAALNPVGTEPLPTQWHYLLGDDPDQWRNAPAYAGVIYPQLAEGVSLQLRDADGRVEYDLLLEPGADLADFSIRCEGARSLRLDSSGALVIETAAGDLRQTPPVSWQLGENDERIPLPSSFRLIGADSFGFLAPSADPALRTVIDPGLDWSTFLGGSLTDYVTSVAVTVQGDLLLTGTTISTDFPGTPGAFDLFKSGGNDGFVAKLSSDGSQLLWATYLGGSAYDETLIVRPDSLGRPVVLGYTESVDYPTTPGAFDQVKGGLEDGFVARLSADGSMLEWSTFLGGMFFDELGDLTIASNDEVIVVGATQSPDFPTFGSAASAMSGFPGSDGSITRFSADGSTVLMSTCLHGPTSGFAFEDFAGHVLILPGGGSAVVLGETEDASFPVTAGTLDTIYSGNRDGYLAIVNLVTGAIEAATFIGGSFYDEPTDLAVSPGGTIYAVVHTESPDFPVHPSGYDLLYDDRGDVAVIALDGSLVGSGPGIPLHGSFFGTPGDEDGAGIAIAPDGSILLVGGTNHPGLPTTLGAWDTVFNGGVQKDDLYIARMNSSLTTLNYLSYLGGTQIEVPTGLAVTGPDSVVISGATLSADFPTRAGSYDRSLGGSADGFVLRLDLRPCPILQILPDPLVRGQQATFRVSELAPGERAFLLFGTAGLGFGSAAGPLGGLNLDLAGAISLLNQTGPANVGGVGTLTLTIPPSVALNQIWFQAAVKRGAGASHSLKSNVVSRAIQ